MDLKQNKFKIKSTDAARPMLIAVSMSVEAARRAWARASAARDARGSSICSRRGCEAT